MNYQTELPGMDYQIVLPGFTRCFYKRVLTYIVKIGRWGVALDLIERKERLYALYHR